MYQQPLCPKCQQATRPLRVLSFVSHNKNYFQCDACGCLSERSKGGMEDLILVHDVTTKPPAVSV